MVALPVWVAVGVSGGGGRRKKGLGQPWTGPPRSRVLSKAG